MTVRSTLKTITTIDKSIDQFVDDFNQRTYDIGQRAFKTIQAPLLDELQFYPPELPNQRYIRTYRLKRGWKAGVSRIGGDKFALVISNDVNYTVFVVGSLAQAESAASRFQADIHQGRWPLATNTVKFWQDAYIEEIEKEFALELAAFGTVSNNRRAFTGRTR